jgi:hypothetical protein
MWSPANSGERLLRASRLLSLAEEAADDDLRLIARVIRIPTFLEAGDFDAARREANALEGVIRETRHPHAQWYPPMYEAMWRIAKGDFGEAELRMKEYLEIGSRFGDANVEQTFLLQAAEIAWQRGGAASIIEAVGSNVARNPALGEWECALAFLMACSGRAEEARRLAWFVVRGGCERVLGRMNAAIGIAALAECCLLLRDEQLAKQLEPVAESIGERVIVAGYGVLCWGSFSRVLGHLAAVVRDWDRAAGHYRSAIRVEETAEADVWRARSQVALAHVLRHRGRRGDEVTAERLVADADAVGRRLGLSRLHVEEGR